MNIVFIGSNPSQKSSSIMPFWSDARSSKTLKSWVAQLNLAKDSCFFYMNVVNQPTPNNRSLRTSEIKGALPLLEQHIKNIQADKIVTFGKSAGLALTLLRLQHYTMPHPSGLNRQLNNKNFIAEKIKGLQEYLERP